MGVLQQVRLLFLILPLRNLNNVNESVGKVYPLKKLREHCNVHEVEGKLKVNVVLKGPSRVISVVVFPNAVLKAPDVCH